MARDKNFVNNYLKKPTNTAPALSARQALELEREVQIFNDLAGLLAEKRAPIIRGLDQDCIDDVVVDAEEMALADSNEDEAALKRVKTKIEGEESLLRMRVPLYKSESKVAPVNVRQMNGLH